MQRRAEANNPWLDICRRAWSHGGLHEIHLWIVHAHVFSTFFVPGTVLGARVGGMNKIKFLPS